MTLKLGCIADDFTGATDLANNLVRAGMRVVQTIGVPVAPVPDVDAVVVALKFTRLTKQAMVVSFIGDALVIHEARNSAPSDLLVALITGQSTATDLKRQVTTFMEQLHARMRARDVVVDAPERATDVNVN